MLILQNALPWVLRDARARVAAVLDEIDRLKQSEFPYEHPLKALEILEKRFRDDQSQLGKLHAGSTSDVVHNACRNSLHALAAYMPLLGFILRATNVRNAFEAYGPLQRLANKVVGADAKLIISSEWSLHPFSYLGSSTIYDLNINLNEFVFIGLPAPESSNPLLLSLAGHELSHFIWKHENLLGKYSKKIEQAIWDELLGKRWKDYSAIYPTHKKDDLKSGQLYVPKQLSLASTWAGLQTEELFCDFMGLKMFAEAYLHAFAYLLSPGATVKRPLSYPNIERRVAHLVQAADEWGISVPEKYAAAFAKQDEPDNHTAALFVSIADTVSSSLVKELVDSVATIAKEKEVPSKDPEKVKRIVEGIRESVVPVRESASLIDIMNSGWECNRDETLWRGVPQIEGSSESEYQKNRERVLRDIMLKSMEISEVYERLKEQS